MSILALAVLMPTAAPAQFLGSLLEQASVGRTYQPISPGEFLQAEYLFLRTLKGERSNQLRHEWHSVGFTMQQVNENGTALLVLHESEGRRLGRGLYAFRQSLPRPIALQAPHGFKEYHTRQIILTMMRESNVAAAAWNTVPRTLKQFGATIDADVAHQEFSFYKAFSRAFATLYSNGHIIQIHGFAQQKRKTQAGAAADRYDHQLWPSRPWPSRANARSMLEAAHSWGRPYLSPRCPRTRGHDQYHWPCAHANRASGFYTSRNQPADAATHAH